MKTKSIYVKDVKFSQKFYKNKDEDLTGYTKVMPVTHVFSKAYCYAINNDGLHCFDVNTKVYVEIEPVHIDLIQIGENFQIYGSDKTFTKVDVKNSVNNFGMCEYKVEPIDESLVYKVW